MPSADCAAASTRPAGSRSVRLPPEHCLYYRDGDAFCPATRARIIEAARYAIALRFHPGAPILGRSRDVEAFLRLELAPRDWQSFAALLLDRQRRLVAFVELFRGTLDHVCVPTREVLREVMTSNAASVIFARNEPCGCASPTPADKETSARLARALRLIDVPVLDYLVIGTRTTSLRARGLL